MLSLMKYFSDLDRIKEDYGQSKIQHLVIMAHSHQMEDRACEIPIKVVKQLYCKSRYLIIETITDIEKI